ncbi:Fc receptor-like protein 5 [Aquarana catesbeiana]|uniref:Fc receptor-like protein 5 n=1 Tax=Aquarana catesbeiana TaxID=8400 RepID=UPI003CC92912
MNFSVVKPNSEFDQKEEVVIVHYLSTETRKGLCSHGAVAMSRLTPIIFIFLALKNTEAAVTPVVTLSPNWNNVYSGDWVTLSCSVGSVEDNDRTYSYTWYKDNNKYERSKTFIIIANVEHNGVYKCSVESDIYSNPVQLHVISGEKSERAFVTMSPNWGIIFTNEMMTMTCYTTKTQQHYVWKKDGKQIKRYSKKEFIINRSTVGDSGNYQCGFGGNDLSFPVILEVKSDYLILQAPPNVIEGDSLSLSCINRPRSTVSTANYFYNDNELSGSRNDILHIPNVNTSMSGTYKCEKYFNFLIMYKQWIKAEKYIYVQDLFSAPEIQNDLNSVLEGVQTTFTCNTRLNRLRGGTELHFAFYRDGRTVQKLSSSNTYRVQSAQLEDSGKYTCEVRTTSDTVRKNSNVIFIQIQELFPSPEIIVDPSLPMNEGEWVTMECVPNPIQSGTTLLYTFYKDSHIIQSADWKASYVIGKAGEENSGRYQCSVQSWNRKVRKNSTEVHILVQKLFTTPEIRVGPSLLVKEGEQVTLECVTDPKEKTGLKYLFYKDSQIIQSAAIKNIYVIDKAKEENTGSYQCSVQSQDGNVRKNSTNIYILIQSINITMDKDNKDFVYGESLTLNCSIKKGMSPLFLWLHNETVVEKDSAFYQLRDNGKVLYIESLQSHHAGTYSCKVSKNLADNKPFYIVETFQINQILESHPLGSNIIWPVLGVLALLLLLVVILLFVKKRKLSSLFSSLCHQQNSESTFDKDRPRDDGRSENEGTNGPDETDNNQQLYGNVSSQEEEGDISYTYIDISKIKGPTNKKDEPSVVYSVLKPPGASTESQATQETDDSANVYQNFNAERH